MDIKLSGETDVEMSVQSAARQGRYALVSSCSQQQTLTAYIHQFEGDCKVERCDQHPERV